MGLDYEYSLRLRRSQLAEIVLAVADIAEPSLDPSLEVILPGESGTLHLPFTSRFKSEPVFCDSQEYLCFDTTLPFECDEVLERYARVCEAQGDSVNRNSKGRICLGYVYLTIRLRIDDNLDNQAYLDFVFWPATSQMSLLFAASESVRSTFVQLLRYHEGLLGEFRGKYRFSRV